MTTVNINITLNIPEAINLDKLNHDLAWEMNNMDGYGDSDSISHVSYVPMVIVI